MDSACEKAIQRWLAELEAPTPDPMRAAIAARSMAACLGDAPQVAQFKRALQSERVDAISCESCQARLPELIQAQLDADVASDQDTDFQAVRDHLALCPHCAAAYADVTEWLVMGAVDAVPVAEEYPDFVVPPLGQSTATPVTPAWSTDVVQRAIRDGKAWVEDALGGVYLLLAQGIQIQHEPGWALKSGAPGALLAQSFLGSDEIDGWEIEMSVFADAESDALCHIEVAVYNPDDPNAALGDIAVTLHTGESMVTRPTNEGGVVEFAGIPRTALEQVVIRVTLPQ